MEISDYRVYTLNPPLPGDLGDARADIDRRYWTVIELETTTGLRGTGWLQTWQHPELYHKYAESLADSVLGHDPINTTGLQTELVANAQYYPGVDGLTALPRSAIDVAAWDIKAKLTDQPLYRYLGGDTQKIPAYCSRLDAALDKDTLVEKHTEAVAAGFPAVKMKVGDKPLATEIERVSAVREAIGPATELLVDANQAWTPQQTQEAADRLAPLDIGWLEEPINQWHLDARRRLGNRLNIPVAAGEMQYHPDIFNWLMTNNVIQISQPDLLRCGGITGLRQVSSLAATHNIPFAPHIHPFVSAHLVSAAPTGRYVEYIPEYDIASLLQPSPDLADGRIVLPDTPGHGYEISPAAKTEYLIADPP